LRSSTSKIDGTVVTAVNIAELGYGSCRSILFELNKNPPNAPKIIQIVDFISLLNFDILNANN